MIPRSPTGNKRPRIGDSSNKNPVFMEGISGVKPLNPMEPETAQLQKLVRVKMSEVNVVRQNCEMLYLT